MAILLFQVAEQTFKEALGEGIWLSILNGKIDTSKVDSTLYSVQYRDLSLFQQLEEDGITLELPWDKVTSLFNYARLLEQLHDSEKASLFYRLILFKVYFFSLSLCSACVQALLSFRSKVLTAPAMPTMHAGCGHCARYDRQANGMA